jgi:energy-coupling factor transport system substrate-specific component
MLTRRRRTVTIFLVSVALNLFLFLLAHFLKLPLWLDTTGTIYITLLLGFPGGFLVGLINNVILSLFFYGFNSISYYVVSAAIAFVAGICVKRRLKNQKALNSSFLCFLSIPVFLLSIGTAIPITLLVDNGIPSDYWGKYLFFAFSDKGLHTLLATALSTKMVKLLDVIVSMTIVMAAFKFTPKHYKCDEYLIRE